MAIYKTVLGVSSNMINRDPVLASVSWTLDVGGFRETLSTGGKPLSVGWSVSHGPNASLGPNVSRGPNVSQRQNASQGMNVSKGPNASQGPWARA
jgi:hypothetical protein